MFGLTCLHHAIHVQNTNHKFNKNMGACECLSVIIKVPAQDAHAGMLVTLYLLEISMDNVICLFWPGVSILYIYANSFTNIKTNICRCKSKCAYIVFHITVRLHDCEKHVNTHICNTTYIYIFVHVCLCID